MSQEKVVALIQRGDGSLIDDMGYPIFLTAGDDDRGTVRRNSAVFHFAVWLAGNDVSDFMILADVANTVVVNTYEQDKIVLFGKRKDRDDYLEWKKRISAWYITRPMEDDHIPVLPPTGTKTIHMVEADFNSNTSWLSDEMFDTWSWITHNCIHGAVWMIHGGFAFEDHRDAVRFKLCQDFSPTSPSR